MAGTDPILAKLRATPRSPSRHHLGRKRSELRVWVEKNYDDIRQLVDVEDRTLDEIADHAADAGYRLANGEHPDGRALSTILYRVRKSRTSQPKPPSRTTRETAAPVPPVTLNYLKKKE